MAKSPSTPPVRSLPNESISLLRRDYRKRSHDSYDSITFHAYSIWLFTLSDLKTIMGPSVLFGIANALVADTFGVGAPKPVNTWSILRRTPIVIFWVWINLLPFTIDNQRRPEAISEDAANKPWRTLPSGRLTPSQARRLVIIFYPLAFLSSIFLGGIRHCTALLFLGVCYNDLGGADASSIIRNLINSCGYICFTSGAMEIALAFPISSTQGILPWLVVIGAVVLTTVQTQDLYDQEGDRRRGRKTMPLEIGDSVTRWVTAVFILFWSYVCPFFWSLPIFAYAPTVFLGGIITWRVLMRRSVSNDKLTFKVWNVWMVAFYLLPLLHNLTLGHY